MKIRKLRASDIHNGFLATLNSFRPTSEKDILKALTGKRIVDTFVAIENKEVIGTYSVLFERKCIHKAQRVAHIEDVVIHPAHRGRGIGQLLMAHALELANNKNCYKIILDCSPDLVDFYKKCGFHKTEIINMRLDILP